jgi:S-sulfo-L-cysteine synthase (3-phospho-L-serine-dependent)
VNTTIQLARPPHRDRPAKRLSSVGNTPVIRIGSPFTVDDRGFWAKLEGANPSGSMKDRAAQHMLMCARQRGELTPGAPIVESTSGSLGLGLALAGAVHGHPVVLVTDPGMEPALRRLAAAYGARISLVTTAHPTGGWQQARLDRVQALRTRLPGSFFPDQYNNPDNIRAYLSLGAELISQLGHIDILVCSVGTGGHSSGAHTFVREHCPDVRLVGVDAVGSTIFGQPAGCRLMRGLGSSIYPRNVDYPAFNQVHWVSPSEAAATCRRLAATGHVTGGWSVGAVTLVASWLARNHSPDTRIAAVFPDGPLRYFDSVFNDEFCRRNGLLGTEPPADPEEISDPRDRLVTRWTMCATVRRPRQSTC